MGETMNGTAVILIIVGIILLTIIGIYNSLVNSYKKVERSRSLIDIYLKKRFDLIPNLVECVKGYAKHEQETLEKIIAMRNPGRNSSLAEKQEFANQTADAIKALNVVVEQYPTLKADTQFTAIQNHIADVEEQLQAARRLYNANVSSYNQSIIVFPASLVAGSKFTKRDFFEAEESKREDVKIEF